MYSRTRRRSSHPKSFRYHAETLEPRVLLAANVVINELMYHAASQNPSDEWIELYNSGDVAADLGGWNFSKGISYTFAPGTSLAAGGYLVVAHDLAQFQATHLGISNVVGPWQGSLGNNGDDLELDDATGAAQDKLSYGSEGDWGVRRQGPLDHNHTGWIWTTPADGGGRSMELMNPALGNDSGQNWAPSTINGGTPGAPNTVASADIAPEILGLKNFPLIPKSTDPVTITARIVDEQATGQTVAVHWRIDGTATWNTAPMADDGAHNDGAAGDGVWGAVLPAQPNNTVVELYVSATDATGHTRTWPGPTDAAGTQAANVLYQVDDTTYTGNQPMFKLIMTDAQRAELALIGSNSFDGLSNAQMNGTFIGIDGAGTEVRYTIGIRNRGGGSRHLPPNNYRININNDNRWHGLRALDANGQYSMEDITGSAVVRAAGLSAQQAVPVQVRVNNANLASAGQFDMFGTYSWVEAENSDLVKDEFPTDSNGNYYRGVDPAHNANLSYLGSDPSLYSTLYPKQTNSEVNDYSDLIALIRALVPDTTQNPEPQYLAAIQQNLDVTEWMRYFAVNALLGNEETALGTGYGDDFSLYRGLTDTQFRLLPHDLDTILGRGDSPQLVNPNETIFKATTLPVVNRFLKDPTLAPIFYQQLLQLAQTTFSASQIGPILDNALKGYVPQAVIDSMKTFAAQRVAGVLAQIPQSLTAASPLAVNGGYPYTTGNTTSLSGQADVIKTRSVLVNGAPVAWTAWQGTWSAPSVALHPGINRVLVQSLDGNGNEVTHTYVDIWRDTGVSTAVSGTLPTGVTEWTLTNAPYHVTGTVTVPAGGTLIIDPGVTVFFEPNTGLTVNGLLNAQGTALQKIVLARTPTAAGAWDRVLVTNTQADGKIAYAAMENAGSGSENIQVINARLDIDHLEWLGTTTHIVDFVNASFRLTNSIIPTVVNVEPAHFMTMPANGYALVQGNVFGTTTGHNDIFDFTGGARPGPIFQVLDNVFLGTGTNGQVADDILDVDGTDAHIEHNLFMNVIHSPINDTNSAISGGNFDYGSGNVSSNVVSVRNIYYNCDQAIMMKEGNFFSSINDTIVNCPTAAFVFDEPNFAAYPGRGGYIDGDILYNVPHIFANVNDGGTITQINVNHTIDPGIVLAGIGNLSFDPELVNTTTVTDPWTDFQLRPTSPARGTGPNGRDMGALVPTGASISGEPQTTTNSISATLTIGGPDIYGYKYRLNNGAWSAEIDTINPGTPNAIIPPIQLSGLADGTYTVYVVEKNDAGFWQDMAQPTTSKTWTVDSGHSRLLINEVLALNDAAVNHEGTFPDLIELFNDGPTARDISGMSISDHATNPQLFVFPAGTTIDAHGYLVLYANKPDGTSGIHLGFALNGGGEDLKLYDSGGNVVDQVSFGQQLTDLSIGRLPDGSWTLTNPTFGAPNVAHLMGDASRLKINEWLTDGQPPFGDFVELYNTDPLPVPLGGLYLTDHPVTWPDRDQIQPLSFIGGNGLVAFRATGDKTPAPDELNFKLNHDEGMIGLFDPDKHLIDQVIYGSQSAGVSQGRSPDGGPEYALFAQPSPGVSNPAPLPNQTTNYTLTTITDDWHYYQSGPAPAGWQAAGTIVEDSTWSHGGGLLYVETSPLPAPKTTPLTLGQTTYYFRQHFNLPVDPSQLVTFQLQTVVDDGAVVYINGVEVFRIGMPTGAVSYSTFANRTVDNAVIEGPFNLPTAELVRGDNVIAVEVHQAATTSSDIVWGGVLTATANVAPDTTVPPLRVTEIDYNPAPPPVGSPYANEDFEFVELQNTGAQPIPLAGDAFTAGISFTFPTMTLDPGQYVLVVKNQAAFQSRYGAGFNIAGQYTGNLDDTGEEVRLQTASGQSILDFAYAASWYPSTNGLGHTLVIRDALANPSTWNRSTSWRASTAPGGSPGAADPAPPQVVGRWIFYNNSAFDGNTSGLDARDDAAIATDKAPLVAGHTATFDNYTSYSRGINGIMIDVAHLPGGAALSASDFLFKVGNDANFAGWLAAPAPSSISVRHNAGGNGIDRIEIIWPDGSIKNQWLQVTMKADDNTLLPNPDVFCFGNAIGESGNSATDALVTSADELAARNDPHSFLNPASITNPHDYNRDGRVDAIDQIIARNNITDATTALKLLSMPQSLAAAAAAQAAPSPLKLRKLAPQPVKKAAAVVLSAKKKPVRK